MASNQGIDLRQFEASFLSAHNKYRKLHGSPPLKLNRNLCSSAQKWADHLLSIRALQHSNSGLGENIYYKSSSNPQDLPGHFTQVVWKDSKEVGYGVATDAKRVYYLVAQYSPAGNITNPGYFQRNVLPAGTAGSR
ncbi:Golgi-associated plant pathogenesis-related protein 1-like isoform X2 [Lithobates pipiens]